MCSQNKRNTHYSGLPIVYFEQANARWKGAFCKNWSSLKFDFSLIFSVILESESKYNELHHENMKLT